MAVDLDYLFVFPLCLSRQGFQGFSYHFGSAYIRAYLKTHGLKTDQFVHSGAATLDRLAELIVERNPRIVGFTCYDANYVIVKLLAATIRKRAPNITIICGGPTATFSDRAVLADAESVDLCVGHYGESACLDLHQWILGYRRIDDIAGITYRTKYGAVRTMDRSQRAAYRPAPDSEDSRTPQSITYERILDVLPDPYLTGILPPESAPDVGVVTSRGCTFPCTYCNFAAMSRRSIAYHSEDRIIRVLRFLEDRLESGKGTKRLIPFNDDNFSLNEKRFHRLLNQMIAEEFENLCFWADMRTESLNNESFELLRQAGFTLLNFGLESATPKVLASVKKVRASGQLADGYEKEQLYLKRLAWAVEKAKNAGLQTSVSTIFGLPGESEADGLARVS